MEQPSYADIMIGNNSASVVSEAYLKGAKEPGYDIETLYQALLHGANNEGPMDAVGRKGVAYYNKLGCAVIMWASKMPHVRWNMRTTISVFINLAKHWTNLKKRLKFCKALPQLPQKPFDPSTKLMRGKKWRW